MLKNNNSKKAFNLEEIKKTLTLLSKKNKNKVPEYLDKLKSDYGIKAKLATKDNEFLKYM